MDKEIITYLRENNIVFYNEKSLYVVEVGQVLPKRKYEKVIDKLNN